MNDSTPDPTVDETLEAPGPPIRVLIVDDDEPHAQAVAESLERVGYDCSTETSGEDGAARIESDHFDVVVTDLMMGDLDGLALLQKTKEELPNAEVILLTHNEGLHEVNLGWHPRAEEVLWRPAIQQGKRSGNGMWNVRYRDTVKARGVRELRALVERHAPWLRIRYAF